MMKNIMVGNSISASWYVSNSLVTRNFQNDGRKDTLKAKIPTTPCTNS